MLAWLGAGAVVLKTTKRSLVTLQQRVSCDGYAASHAMVENVLIMKETRKKSQIIIDLPTIYAKIIIIAIYFLRKNRRYYFRTAPVTFGSIYR